jgi:hypothetical protein
MTLMLGLGLTQVIFLDRLGPGRAAAPTGPTHSLYGWRVRWTPSGDTLGVGTAPRTTYDDAPAARWVLVRPRLWASYRDSLGAASDSSRFAPVPWVEGPTMEIGTPVVVEGRRVLTIDGGTVEVRNGQIVLEARGRDGRTNVRVVGPGRPLVATAGGRFVAALVDRPAGERHEARVQLVVYHVPPQ